MLIYTVVWVLGKIHKHTYYTANIHILRLCLFINDHQINVNIVCTTHITHHRNPPHNVNWVTWGSKTMKMKRFLRCVCVCVLRSVLPPKYKISVQWNHMLTWDTLMLPIWVFFFCMLLWLLFRIHICVHVRSNRCRLFNSMHLLM